MGEWIKCSDRLPAEIKQDCLIFFDEHGEIALSEWLNDETLGWCFWYGDPSHWQPLPEPPHD